jgi:hypothetical protein
MSHFDTNPKNFQKEPNLQSPFVSVIMPIRNEAGFIKRSLGAVLTQDYPGVDRFDSGCDSTIGEDSSVRWRRTGR